jgi:hypothetical protein
MIITGLALASQHGPKRLKKQVAATLTRIFFSLSFGMVGHDRYI